MFLFFFFSSRRRHTRCSRDWSSDVCSSDLAPAGREVDDPMPRMPTNSGEPMEEFTPLDPSVAPPYNLIAERLFRARTVIISGEITQRVAAGVMAQLLALEIGRAHV